MNARRFFFRLLSTSLIVAAGASIGCSGGSDADTAGGADAITAAAPVGDLQGQERKDFLEVVRQRFYQAVGRSTPAVEFVIKGLKVGAGAGGEQYGFIQAQPVQPGTTKDYDYHGTPVQEDIDGGLFDGNVLYATLRKDAGVWVVLQFAIGPTDVAWADMPCQGAPASIFPGSTDAASCKDQVFAFKRGKYSFSPQSVGSAGAPAISAGTLSILSSSGSEAIFDLDVTDKAGHRATLKGVVADAIDATGGFEAFFDQDCKLEMRNVHNDTILDVEQVGSCAATELKGINAGAMYIR